jgi:hypothetical protein
MGRPRTWWQLVDVDDPDAIGPEALLGEWQQASLAAAQQVGEEVGELTLTWQAEHQPCPACGRLVIDHTRRELRRCDSARPALEIV